MVEGGKRDSAVRYELAREVDRLCMYGGFTLLLTYSLTHSLTHLQTRDATIDATHRSDTSSPHEHLQSTLRRSTFPSPSLTYKRNERARLGSLDRHTCR